MGLLVQQDECLDNKEKKEIVEFEAYTGDRNQRNNQEQRQMNLN